VKSAALARTIRGQSFFFAKTRLDSTTRPVFSSDMTGSREGTSRTAPNFFFVNADLDITPRTTLDRLPFLHQAITSRNPILRFCQTVLHSFH
jgi:hypothetical protein